MVAAYLSNSVAGDLDPALRERSCQAKGEPWSPSLPSEEEITLDSSTESTSCDMDVSHSSSLDDRLAAAKASFKALLQKHNGSAKSPEVVKALEELSALNPTTDAALASCFEGVFVSSTRPEFPGRLKQSPENDHIDQYTLGRMSFGIFQPKDLVCTIVKTRNTIQLAPQEHTPGQDGSGNHSKAFTYFLETDIIIHTPKGNFEASLQMDAFCSSAKQPKNRLGVTFTGGTMVPALSVRSDADQLAAWKQVFEGAYQKAEAERSYVSSFFTYIFKWIFQLTTPTDEEAAKHESCAVRFEMKRCPHGYIDVVYLDDDLRVTRGNRGTIVVVERSQN